MEQFARSGVLYLVGSDLAETKNTMTYFPHNPLKRVAGVPAASLVPVRPAIMRDILWNRPVFKAPTLPNPRVALDPLPFTATRLSRHPPEA